MTIFMALLPVILAAMGRLQGISSTVQLEISVFKRYFVFQLFNFFLLTVFASSVFDELDNMISYPTEIPTLLARSLPASSTVFINYIMLRALNANMFEMLDVPRMVLAKILLMFASTPTECLAAWYPDPFKYGRLLPEALLIAIVGFCFSTIQPVILPFAATYFATLMMWHKHHYVFQHVTPMESGGAFWPLIFDRLILGMVISQLCVLGLFGLKEVPVEAAMMLPLIIGTLVFWNHCRNVYGLKMDNIHLANAVATDKARSALTDVEKRALIEGHELASMADEIIPMLMPDRYADCMSHDERVAAIARGEIEPGTDAEKAASARGDAVEGDFGLLYHYTSDGHVFSEQQAQKQHKSWAGVVATPPSAAAASSASHDVEMGSLPDIASPTASAAEALSDRGLTAEQEALLSAVMHRRAEAERIRTERRHAYSVSKHSRSRSVSRAPESPPMPMVPGSPALGPAGALSASCAGDAVLMAKYTQQELAPGRYAVELINPVWSAEYLNYRRMKRGEGDADASAEDKSPQPIARDAAVESPSLAQNTPSTARSPGDINLAPPEPKYGDE
jgi:hypothetical protein